ncbi:MAG: adenylate/guanylate cyclase domain-containing protein [Proteobacteria bacterium]|nr:adenylate/guanylate cyclase domain-containing protein [Pseudomonadota bacterium]
MSERGREIERWLLTEGRNARTVIELMNTVCPRLAEVTPVERVWAGTKVLHPQAAAYFWIWTADGPLMARELNHALMEKLKQGDTPIRRLEKGAAYVRIRRDERGKGPAVSDILDLWDQGYTDFYALPLIFKRKWVGGYTFATRSPDGFVDADLDVFKAVLAALSAVMQPLAQDLVTATLLRTYLGRDAGTRVFEGQVRRGEGQSVRAVIWFSDVRGFTRMSNELPPDVLLGLLNDNFELMVGALEDNGGEVLKFMGDGLLAVFTVEDDDHLGKDACAAARRASAALTQGLVALRARRQAAGLPVADLGVALHFGTVSYGNIGAPARLDFTVIGREVNTASRIEGLCATLGEPILASGEFVIREGGDWEPCGTFELKGVDRLVVYRPKV